MSLYSDLIFIFCIFSKTYPSFIDKAGCTQQFESELSLRSFAPIFPIKEGSTSLLGLLQWSLRPLRFPLLGTETSGERGNHSTQCCICPTCSSPVGGSLILNQALPLTIKGKDVAGSAIAPPEFWYRQRSLCPKGLPKSVYATELRLFVG